MTTTVGNLVRVSVLCLVSACSPDIRPPLQTTDAEQATRERIKQEVQKDFLKKDFAALEAKVAQYRQAKSRTPSGLWTLGRFYSAFSALYNEREPAESWLKASKIALAWAKQYPDSPAPHIVYAMMLSEYGWRFRGYDTASEVDDKAWEPFHKNQALARAYLEQHKSVAARDPNWYAVMLSILKTEDVDAETIRQYYLEGVKLEPLYLPLHMEALNNFIPKWGGSAEEVDDLILLATEQVEKSQRDMLYARLYWASMNFQFHEDEFFHVTKVNWPRMRRGMTAVVHEYPDIWNIFHFTFFACYAGDKEVAAIYIPVLQPYEAGSWFENYTAYKLCKEWIFNNGPNVDQALIEFNAKMQAEELEQQDRLLNGDKYYKRNQQYKEQMKQEYARRRQELIQKSRTVVPGTPAFDQMGHEFDKLDDLEMELNMRDPYTDWGLDYALNNEQPPAPYYDHGVCPCCNMGKEWTSAKDTVLRKDFNDASPAVGTVKSGEKVNGLTGVVITTKVGPVKILVPMTLATEDGESEAELKPGDVIYNLHLHYVGKGYDKFWFKGQMLVDQTDIRKVEKTEFWEVLDLPVASWWVKIKRSNGETGWTRDTKNFQHMDACASLQGL
jgi:hypothetical protein